MVALKYTYRAYTKQVDIFIIYRHIFAHASLQWFINDREETKN